MSKKDEEIEIEEPAEERLTLKSLKKEFDLFKNEIFQRLPPQPLNPVHHVHPNINPDDVSVGDAKESVIFHFTDRFADPRIFSEAINGPEWLTLANNFQQNNAHQIKKREDL